MFIKSKTQNIQNNVFSICLCFKAIHIHWGFPGDAVVKNLPANARDTVQSLGWEDLLEEEMATRSSILAWKIQWTEKPRGYSPWGHKVSDTTEHAHRQEKHGQRSG